MTKQRFVDALKRMIDGTWYGPEPGVSFDYNRGYRDGLKAALDVYEEPNDR